MFRAIIVLFLFYTSSHVRGQQYEIKSPDAKIKISVEVKDKTSFSVFYKEKMAIAPSMISMTVDENLIFGDDFKVMTHEIKDVFEEMEVLIPHKDKFLTDAYQMLLLKGAQYSLEFRAYNDGVGYRFTDYRNKGNKVTVFNEKLDLNFPDNGRSLFPEEESMYSHFERKYLDLALSAIDGDRFCSLPVLIRNDNGTNVLISESGVFNYPHLFLQGTGGDGLTALHPKYVLETKDPERDADRNEIISKKADYISINSDDTAYPWRTFIIGDTDNVLIESNLNRLLGGKQMKKDYSWIKPGKVAWDWYNALNIYDVDFVSGINTETYKYYIDFASDYGIEYVILDEGWTKSTTEILESNPDIDIAELVEYGKNKGVALILWVLWKPLEADTEKIISLYKSWGAVGIKVDFMQRADQAMVRSYENIAKIAGDHQMLVDFHGAFKPAGLRNKYPNILSYEGVKGSENNKWEDAITPDHNLTIPFIRMAAGPMDYTPGAMRNAGKDNFSISFTRPMSQGTRCHQVAMYVVYESPIQMLCDVPSSYRRDHYTADFIVRIPTIWDETDVLEASVGDYILLWRRSGDNYYIGGMTDWDPRDFNLRLDFLPEGEYRLDVMQDGINADKMAEDYTRTISKINSGDKISIKMAPGGGYAAILTKI